MDDYGDRVLHKVEVRMLKKYYDAKTNEVKAACHAVFQPFLPTDYTRPECPECFEPKFKRRGSFEMAS